MNEDLTIKAISTYNANLHRGMTAALEAVVAMALEEAARVVTEHYETLCAEHRLLLVNRASAIRALIDKE